jgi:DNA-3-methyladenine glycosylase
VSTLRVETHPEATAVATTPIQDLQALPQSFFARPAEQVAPDLIGCLLVKRQPTGEQLWGVIVETEAYSQDDPACHGYRRRSPSNETLFGEPGRFYVYVSYGIHHCVKRALTSKTPSSSVRIERSCVPSTVIVRLFILTSYSFP